MAVAFLVLYSMFVNLTNSITSVMRESNMNILVVEDDMAVSKLIVENVETWGHSAKVAVMGKEALEKLAQDNFRLILLDIFLPDIKGHNLIPNFKKLSPEIDVITMTGENSRELEKEVRSKGILYYMTKPFEFESLKAIIDHIEKGG